MPNKGDGNRNSGEIKNGISSYFETNNRGVKSLTLNLKSDQGKKILHKLIEKANVFGQNFSPGAAERNGFGYEDLKKINPAIVYASVSAYGPDGPSANLQAFRRWLSTDTLPKPPAGYPIPSHAT